MATREHHSSTSLNGHKVTNLQTPTNPQDGTTKAYVDSADAVRQPLDSDLTTIAALSPTDDDVMQRKAGAWTNRSIPQLKTDLSLVPDTQAQLALLAANAATAAANVTAQDNLRVLKVGDVMTGNLAAPTMTVGQAVGERVFYTSFTAGTANQKMDLYFTTTGSAILGGMLDVWILGVGAAAGVICKRYALSLTGSTATYNFARYAETMGPLQNFVALSDLTWDATNSRWKIQVVHQNSLACSFAIVVQPYSGDTASDVAALLPTFGLGAVYTTDVTVQAFPVVWFQNLIVQSGVVTAFRSVAASTTLSAADSIILCSTGLTVTLPTSQSAGQGRTYTVKNLQNLAVTVNVTTAGGTIDGVASKTVGNKEVLTFVSDGANWWITGAA